MDGWKAARYQHPATGRWVEGKIHWIKEKPDNQWEVYDPGQRKKLLCGKWLDAVAGELMVKPPVTAINCGMCAQKKITLEQQPAEDLIRAERAEQFKLEFEERRAAERREYMNRLRERYERPDWELLRARVLERDKFTCQGCLKARATTVHHLTYARLGEEMLFDLISVCGRCHAKIHPHLRDLPF